LNAQDENHGRSRPMADRTAPAASLSSSAEAPSRKGRRRWIPALLAALVVLGVWGPNLMRPPPPAWTFYTSAKGQTRRITLTDHSVLRLNGASVVRVVFEDQDRRAALSEAEAAFLIAYDSRRPFLIAAGDRQVRTDGGEFNLRRQFLPEGVRTTLTMRQGRAEVRLLLDGQDEGRDAGMNLGPGDQLSWIDGQALAMVRRVNPDNAFAWETHRLIYDRTPLGEVVTDLNRYVVRPIRLSAPSLAAIPFTGVLPIDSEDRMLRRLEAALPVHAQPLAAEIVLRPATPCRIKGCDRPGFRQARAAGAFVQSLLKLRPHKPAPAPAKPAPVKPALAPAKPQPAPAPKAPAT
jgi:transmembrane sensor